jgi:polyhydroxybutyrate depolymerase
VNPLEGGDVAIGTKRYGQKPPVEEMLGRWIEIHGCRPTPRTVFDRDGAKGLAYSRPDADAIMVVYTLDGHGHHWPGGKSLLPQRIAGEDKSRLEATNVIWTFFERHVKPPKEKGNRTE